MGFSKVSEAFSFCLAGFQPRAGKPLAAQAPGPTASSEPTPPFVFSNSHFSRKNNFYAIKRKYENKASEGRQRVSRGWLSAAGGGRGAGPGGRVPGPRCGLPADQGSPCPSLVSVAGLCPPQGHAGQLPSLVPCSWGEGAGEAGGSPHSLYPHVFLEIPMFPCSCLKRDQ